MNGTGKCVITIEGAPESEAEIKALAWLLQEAPLMLNGYAFDYEEAHVEAVAGTFFRLPYSGAPGEITIERVGFAHEEYTGYYVSFNYADSMTSPWGSPVWLTPHGYTLDEY